MNFKKTLSIAILSTLLCSSPAFAMIQNTSKRCWTEEENQLLLHAFRTEGSWEMIAAQFPDRTLKACQMHFDNYIRPLCAELNIYYDRWTPQENQKLIDAHRKYPEDWEKIAGQFPFANKYQCRIHFLDIKSAYQVKWTQDENQKLINAYKTHGENWKAIAEQFPERTKKQCRIHFYDIEPAYKVKWTPDEDETLIYLNNLIGNKWDCISKSLPGRTPMRCQRRFLKLKPLKSAFEEILEDSEAISENSENRLSALLPPDFSIEALLNSH